jgi:hypothetical protein
MQLCRESLLHPPGYLPIALPFHYRFLTGRKKGLGMAGGTIGRSLPVTRRNELKLTKILGILAAAAPVLMAFASTAFATTFEVKGVKQTSGITIEASLKAGTSGLQSDTFGFFINTCTVSTIKATTETDTTDIIEVEGVKKEITTKATAAGFSALIGPVTAWSWGTAATPCKEGNPTVHDAGTLSVEWIKGTTNGTVKSGNAVWTTPSAFGTLTCKTPAEGTDFGTLTGVAAGNATIDINTVLSCGIDLKWTGTYTLTGTNAALGVGE